MYCAGCGAKLEDDVRFCYRCGKPVENNLIARAGQDAGEPAGGKKQPDRGQQDHEEWFSQEQPGQGRPVQNRQGGSRQSGKKPSGRKRLLRLLAIALLLILSAFAGAGLALLKNNLETGVSEKIGSEISEITEPYLNEDGVFDYDEEQLNKAGEEVYAYAMELVQQGEIADATYCEEAYSVAFYLNDGTIEVFLPEIADMYAGAGEEDEEEFSVMLVNNFFNEDDLSLAASEAMYYSNPLDIISGEFEGASTQEYSQSVTVDSLKTLLSSFSDSKMRAVFWRGHGGTFKALNNETVFFFVLGEKESDDEDKYAAERLKDENGISQVLTTTSGHYAVTYQYMEQYLGQNSGGLFFTTSCLAMADGGKMAETFLDKGFDSYVGSTDVVNILYGNRLLKEVVQNLCKKDSDGLYMTIGDALREAADTLSEVSFWTPLGDFIDIYGQLFGTFVNYQQFDFRLVDNSKIYCTLTSQDGTVDLSRLSVKLVRTDENGTHTASDTRIEGAELAENGGRFLIYDLSTDASCQLDISYGTTLFKKYSIDQIDPGTEEITIDLSLAYLDVIVQDQQEQFLTNATVSIYGKAGDSGTEGLIQTAGLISDESGQKVYRLPVTPGIYYITVTVDGRALVTADEVTVTGNTTVTYVQKNLEEQAELLAGLCGSLVTQDSFAYATYLECWMSDYDQNGLMELNLSVTEGSGIFTTWRCYEVNEALDGVTEIVWDYDTYWPDGFTDLLPGSGEEDSQQQTEPCYYDESSGAWYYIMYDVVRSGWAENGTSYYSMTKNGSALQLEELGWLRNVNSDDGTTTTTYTIGESTCGTEADFYGAMLEKVSDMTEFSYTILSFDILDSTDYYTDLWNSASAFLVSG